MKTRIIHTKIYEDGYFSELSPIEKLVFIYYLTNSNVNIIHCYECTDRKVMFELGITKDQLLKAKQKFHEAKKIVFYKDFIRLLNAGRYEKYTGSDNEKAKESIISTFPDDVKEWYLTPLLHPSNREVTGTINHKSEIINNKEDESLREETKDERAEIAKKLIDIFNKKSGHVYKLTDSVREKIYTRLGSYAPQELQTAIEEMFKQPFYRGENQRRWSADPSYLFRNDDNIEKFVAKTKKSQVVRLADIIK